LSLLALSLACDNPASLSERCGLTPLPGSPFQYACPEDVGLHTSDLAALEDEIRSWVENGAIVGAEFMLVKDRRIVAHSAVGWSDMERGTPLERNSIYRIRSMTKPFTGTAILMLIEEGELALDDRVSGYLPSFDNDRSRESPSVSSSPTTAGSPAAAGQVRRGIIPASGHSWTTSVKWDP
jgi:CubicO group peptidase (beta-lactamase class C family)